jgi:hypothetical protein
MRAGRPGFDPRQGLGRHFFFLFAVASREALGPTPFCNRGLFTRDVKLTTHLRLVPRLRMLGAIPPFLSYVFMAWPLVNHGSLMARYLVKHRDNFDRGSRFRFPAGAGNFFLHHRVQTGSGAHPASYPMGTGDFFPEGKTAGAWSWPPTSI